jgi:hypothetical protein
MGTTSLRTIPARAYELPGTDGADAPSRGSGRMRATSARGSVFERSYGIDILIRIGK